LIVLDVEIRRKAYGSRTVLRDIAFPLESGETLAILGPSGAGKTTLLRIVAGLDPAFEGRVAFSGIAAIVFQEPTLLPWRSALENITLVTGVALPEAETALREVGLAGMESHRPGQMSLGQRRRLSLARAFAARPDLLLLDEPFVSLDAPLVAEMMALTERLIAKTRVATLFVTHAPAEAERLADRILRLPVFSPLEVDSP